MTETPFQRNFRALIQHKGWTIRGTAEKTGLSPASITNLKNGNVPRENTIEKIAKAFDVDPIVLCYGNVFDTDEQDETEGKTPSEQLLELEEMASPPTIPIFDKSPVPFIEWKYLGNYITAPEQDKCISHYVMWPLESTPPGGICCATAVGDGGKVLLSGFKKDDLLFLVSAKEIKPGNSVLAKMADDTWLVGKYQPLPPPLNIGVVIDYPNPTGDGIRTATIPCSKVLFKIYAKFEVL